jgi:hypothetical protein
MQSLKTKVTLAAVAGITLLVNAPVALADMASGTYNINGGSYVPVWDISGEYPSDIADFGAMDLLIVQLPNGKFSGTGDFSAVGYYDDVDMDISGSSAALGTVSGPSHNPKVSMGLGVAGSGTVEGYAVSKFTVSMKLNMDIDTNNDWLIGNGSAKISITLQNPYNGRWVTRSGSEPMHGVENSLPANVDGNWNLTLNVVPNGTKYTGTANVVTSPGSSVDFVVTGTYAAKTDVSTITLKGTGWGAGTSLTLVVSTTGPNLIIHSMKGKLFGQTITYKTP